MYAVERYHDISCGHRVFGHEGKCRFLHGHNYRVHFKCVFAGSNHYLDDVGRVVDFGVIKSTLCMWLEHWWDHRFLMWEGDPELQHMKDIDPTVVATPFNPTAENMARYLVMEIGPDLLGNYGILLQTVTIEETAKCSATYTRME